MAKKNNKKTKDDLYEKNRRKRNYIEDDDYDDDLDEVNDTIASVFTSLVLILMVLLIGAAAAFFLSGINIHLRGDEVVEIPVFTEYEDRGATADFDIIKDMNWALKVKDNVNTEVVGEYQVVYSAEYRYWKAEKVRTVKVIDNRCPIIKLKGGRKVTWSTISHKDPGFKAKDNYDGDLTDQVEVETEVADDGNTATMTYTVTDSSGNIGISKRHIFLKDVIAPTLELEGALRIEIPYGGSFTELGYSAYDDLDGDLTHKVQISNIDPSKPGEQTMIYSVTDSSGNTTTDTRTIVVGPKPVVKVDKNKNDKNKTDNKTNNKKKNN
ncbi:MAG: DUF5011 domain-containing protein [Dorea sp.]|nr:DUF5011 domain-containing protein [Dorea sp.]